MAHDPRGSVGGWSVGSWSPRKLQIVFNLLAKCDEDLQDLARGVAGDEDGEEENSDDATVALEGRNVALGVIPTLGAKAAAIAAAEHAGCSKGMKGAKTLAPEGRRVPIGV